MDGVWWAVLATAVAVAVALCFALGRHLAARVARPWERRARPRAGWRRPGEGAAPVPKPVRFALPILVGLALARVDHPAPQVIGVLLVTGTLLAPIVGIALREWAEGRSP